jgi:hypothetical protein
MSKRQNSSAIVPVWAVNVPDKSLEWFYPNVFVRGELNGVQGISSNGKMWYLVIQVQSAVITQF